MTENNIRDYEKEFSSLSPRELNELSIAIKRIQDSNRRQRHLQQIKLNKCLVGKCFKSVDKNYYCKIVSELSDNINKVTVFSSSGRA